MFVYIYYIDLVLNISEAGDDDCFGKAIHSTAMVYIFALRKGLSLSLELNIFGCEIKGDSLRTSQMLKEGT